MLTAHEIDDIVGRLREWLVESNEAIDAAPIEELLAATRNGAAPQTGLLQIAEAFTAMRQEVKLYTKSVRALSVRVETGLGELSQAGALLNKTSEEVQQRGETEEQEPDAVVEQLRPGYLRNGKVLRHAEVKVAAK